MLRRLLPLAFLGAACSAKPPTVAFNQVCAPPDATNCTFSATCDAQYIGPPTVDLGVTNLLWLTVEVHNQASDNTDEVIGRVNTQDAFLQEIDVSYSGGSLAIGDASTRVQQTVPANGTAVISIYPIPTSAGLGPGSLGAGTSTTVIAKVKGKGIFGDGSSFETPDWEVPVTLCNGCLGAIACAAGQTLSLCPPNNGQAPLTFTCQ
jgi:hypothetical protein